MNYNSTSTYPTTPDPLVFFNDITLDQVANQQTYQGLIKQDKYTEANTFFKTVELHGITAGLINAAVNRTFALQTYLKTKTKVNPVFYQNTEPTSATVNTMWVSST